MNRVGQIRRKLNVAGIKARCRVMRGTERRCSTVKIYSCRWRVVFVFTRGTDTDHMFEPWRRRQRRNVNYRGVSTQNRGRASTLTIIVVRIIEIVGKHFDCLIVLTGQEVALYPTGSLACRYLAHFKLESKERAKPPRLRRILRSCYDYSVSARQCLPLGHVASPATQSTTATAARVPRCAITRSS